jgi:hypothetical protein
VAGSASATSCRLGRSHERPRHVLVHVDDHPPRWRAHVRHVRCTDRQRRTSEIHTTKNKPADCPSDDAFNKACRTGRVKGARKLGRFWTCSAEAWAERAPAGRPAGLEGRPRKARAKTLPRVGLLNRFSTEPDPLLEELGVRRKRTG